MLSDIYIFNCRSNNLEKDSVLLDGSFRKQLSCQPSGACRALSMWKVNIQLVAEKQDENRSKGRKDEARWVKWGTFSRPEKYVRHSATDDRTDDAEHYRPN
jgi:hypothetical protein